MKPRPKIVEFIGISGSGKTTLYEKLLKENKNFDSLDIAAFRGLLNNPDIKIFGRKLLKIMPEKIISLLRLTKIRHLYIDQIIAFSDTEKHKKTLTQINKYLHANPGFYKQKNILIYNVLKNISDLLLISNIVNNEKIILVDEFFLQKIYSLKLDSEQILTFINDLDYEIDLLLKFDEDVSVCLYRIKSRDYTRNPNVKNVTKDELTIKLKKAKKITNLIEAALKKKGVKTFQISADTNNKLILDKIAAI